MKTLNRLLLVVILLVAAFVVYKMFFLSDKSKTTTYYQTEGKGQGGAEENYDQLLSESTSFISQNKYEEAKEVLQKAVAMNEDDYRAYYQLGLNAFNQIRGKNDDKENRAKCEEAIQSFDKVVEMKSSYANSYALRGVAYEMLGQDEKALENFSYYLELVDENDNSTLTKQVIARYQRLSGER